MKLVIKAVFLALGAGLLSFLHGWQLAWFRGFLKAVWLPLEVKYLFRAATHRGETYSSFAEYQQNDEEVIHDYRRAVERKLAVDRRMEERNRKRSSFTK